MSPTTAFNDVEDRSHRHAVSLSECLVSNLSGDVGCADFAHLLLRKDCAPMVSTESRRENVSASFIARIGAVVRIGAFGEMAWIKARGIVARMQRAWFRPVTVGKVECNAVNHFAPTIRHHNHAVAIARLCEGPFNTIIGWGQFGKKLQKVFVALSDTLSRHRLSSIDSGVGRFAVHAAGGLCSLYPHPVES
jgi:hypothetical protein